MSSNLDVLIFAAHPDDAEIAMGGTIAKFSKNNYKVGVIDFTRGELGSRGSKEIRDKESADASKILKLEVRENLNLPDGRLSLNDESLEKTVTKIRQYKPKILFAPYLNDRHPDHIAAGNIVKSAFFFSGVVKYLTEFPPGTAQDYYRPKKLFYYMLSFEFKPSFIVDVSDVFELKIKAIEAYKSQFFNEEENRAPATLIASKNFKDLISSRARNFGFQIRKEFGEPFFIEEGLNFDFNTYL